MSHLLVTNDYPPKIGGIQVYLWELWRRLSGDRVTVVTRQYEGSAAFDDASPHRVVRIPSRLFLPSRDLAAEIRRLAHEAEAQLVVLDPALPLGLIGPRLGLPYAVVVHGAEVTVPGRLPLATQLLKKVLSGAELVIAAGSYPLGEVRRALGGEPRDSVLVPPGVDLARFTPLSSSERTAARRHFDLPEQATLIVSVSRLVPRKGMDVLIEAASRLAPRWPDLLVVIGGGGRDRERLERLAHRLSAPVRFFGRVAEPDLPTLVGTADISAMLCRDRWGGLEQEGFGIVFLEAAACGVVQVAGASGGADEAVLDGVTGVVLDRPADVEVAVRGIESLLSDRDRRTALGHAARLRAEAEFDYDMLAARLGTALGLHGG